MYSIEGLENGIEDKRKTIIVLEGAIDKERKEIAQYRIWISELEEAARAKRLAESNVHLELVSDRSK